VREKMIIDMKGSEVGGDCDEVCSAQHERRVGFVPSDARRLIGPGPRATP
jgi:hypothetical protein